MSNTTIDLPSGAKLEIQVAPFAVVGKLRRTVADALQSTSLSTPLERLQKGDVALDDLKNMFAAFLSSEQVETDVFACLKFCLYNGEKITQSTFDEAREDYLPALWEVARVNLTPFFKSLGSVFSGFVAPSTDARK